MNISIIGPDECAPIRPPKTTDSPDERAISTLDTLARCGKAILNAETIYYQPSPSNPGQQKWDDFRLTVVISEHMPMIQHLPASLPLPNIEMEEQSILQSYYIRACSILDDYFQDEIDKRAIKLSGNPRLADRINAFDKAKLLTNGSSLHSIRDIRNKLSHSDNPPKLSWQDVYSGLNEIEKALHELGIINPSPMFKCQTEMSKTNASSRPGELYNRTLSAKISANGQPYCSFNWLYVYFSDPNWKPAREPNEIKE